MHELGIVFYIIKACEKAAQENNAKSIKEITLEVGEVSTIVPSYFKDCFSWAIKKNDLMKDCKLNLVVLEGISYCNDCKKTYRTTKYGKECPYCKGHNTYLVTGSEVNIRDIKIVE